MRKVIYVSDGDADKTEYDVSTPELFKKWILRNIQEYYDTGFRQPEEIKEDDKYINELVTKMEKTDDYQELESLFFKYAPDIFFDQESVYSNESIVKTVESESPDAKQMRLIAVQAMKNLYRQMGGDLSIPADRLDDNIEAILQATEREMSS